MGIRPTFCQYLKVIPFDVVTSCRDVVCNSRKNKAKVASDRKIEHFKAITSTCHVSTIADHVTATGHNIKWDHFEILAKGRSDTHCKLKETTYSGTQTYPKR